MDVYYKVEHRLQAPTLAWKFDIISMEYFQFLFLSQMSPRRGTSVGIAKCWLFSHATFDNELLKTVSFTCKLYYNKVFCGHPAKQNCWCLWVSIIPKPAPQV